jgi:hypothetical protein
MSHPSLQSALHRSSDDAGSIPDWFERIAEVLLNQTAFVICGQSHRLSEIEFYLHSAEHPDPVAHRDPVQVHAGRWYFHRTGGTLRGGSFKGLDLTFGDGASHAGILFRTLETHRGEVIHGPSLLVDHLLRLTGHSRLKDLDTALGESLAWDESQPIYLAPAPWEQRTLVSTARVGLTVRRFLPDTVEAAWAYLFRRYRFVSDPKSIRKGRPHLVLALHLDGIPPHEIRARTGISQPAIERYIAEFESARTSGNHPTLTARLDNPREYCRSYGSVFTHLPRA